MTERARESVRELLSCASALLEQGRTVDRLSRLLTVAALLAMLLTAAVRPPLMGRVTGIGGLVALAGGAQLYLAIRVGFDAALFQRLAASPEILSLEGLDRALTSLGLLPPVKRGRAVEARVAGARRLFRWQLWALGAQVAVLLGGTLWIGIAR